MASADQAALSIFAGSTARERLRREGWHPALFQTMVGASGGAKFLALAELDRFLFGDFLQRSGHAMHLIGSSIGSWRHAALAQGDPLAALAQLQQGYLHQYYAPGSKPDPAHISRVSLDLLAAFLDPQQPGSICDHPRWRSHIVTARGRGAAGSDRAPLQALGLGQAALLNAVSRRALQASFQRVIFSSHGAQGLGFEFSDFATQHAALSAENTVAALHASGSIPFVLTGERDISGAPPGQYWDGGIVDYHFDLSAWRGDGLVLYPHFRGDITPGWFDKFLPWRRAGTDVLDRVVLLCPSPAHVARLPQGKIPDRNDIPRLPHEQRVQHWQSAMEASSALAEEFAALVDGADPLAGVESF